MEPISASSLPSRPLVMAPDRQHVGQAHALRFAEHEFDLPLVIQRRLGVGHAADGGEPPRHRRRRPGGDGLLLLVARLAKMNVNVDQSRRDITAGRVNGAVGFAEVMRRWPRSCRRAISRSALRSKFWEGRGSCRVG